MREGLLRWQQATNRGAAPEAQTTQPTAGMEERRLPAKQWRLPPQGAAHGAVTRGAAAAREWAESAALPANMTGATRAATRAVIPSDSTEIPGGEGAATHERAQGRAGLPV